MTICVSIHKIIRGPADAQQSIEPGTVYDEDEDYDGMLAAGAIREPSPDELSLFRYASGESVDPATKPDFSGYGKLPDVDPVG